VGIGDNVTPSQKLHVAGNIYSINSGTDGGQIRLANSGGGSNWYWAARTTGLNLGELGVADGNIFIANGGNVGIDTTDQTPEKFNVDGNIIMVGGSTNTGYDRYFKIYGNTQPVNNPNRWAGMAVYNNGGNNVNELAFFTGSGDNARTEKVRIDSGGRVGIGTDDPQSKLQIVDEVSTSIKMYSTYNYSLNRNWAIQLNGFGPGNWGGISFLQSTAQDLGPTVPVFGITRAGNVGIGINASNTAVDHKLHVNGSIKIANSNSRLVFGTSGGTDRRALEGNVDGTLLQVGEGYSNITMYGDVGIGVTSPEQKLHVEGRGIFDSGTSSDILQIRNDNGGGVFGMTSNLFALDLASTSAFRIRQGSSVPFYLKSDGNVGIGTTGPAEKLEVSGSVKIGNMKFEPADGGRIGFNRNTANGVIYDSNYAAFQINGAYSGADFLEIQNYASTGGFLGSIALKNGKVGIGTTSPGRKLTVTGDVSGDANNLLLVNENDTDGDSASIGFSMLSNNTYVKAGIFFKRTTTQGRGELILAVNNEVNGNNVTLSDSRLTINNAGDALFYREILAATATGSTMRVPRNLFVSYGGSSYNYTFDPVALFGSNPSGGTLGLRVSGWPTRLFDGIIIWRNDGGGSTKIGTGVVTLVTVATNDFSGVGVTVSLPSANTNEIKISFSGFHSNNHGWECYIKTEY
jgi:hypothetical protein